jgi:hypothetical protein
VPNKQHAIIIASPRARTGKTLLARLIADHLSLSGEPRAIFDTDVADHGLTAFFPDATSIDLDRVPDQMKLFDTLATPVKTTQVIDLAHRSFAKFFNLMREIDFVAEAKANGINPVIFYVPGGDADSYEQGHAIRERFREGGFVLVKNAMLGEPGRDTQRHPSYVDLASHNPRITLPTLDPFFVTAIEDPRLSLSEFSRRSMMKEAPSSLSPERMSIAYLSLEARNAISVWLQMSFNEIRRALKETDLRAEILAHDRFGA